MIYFCSNDVKILTEAFVSPTLPTSSWTLRTKPTTTTTRQTDSATASSSTELFGKRVKRGSFASLASVEAKVAAAVSAGLWSSNKPPELPSRTRTTGATPSGNNTSNNGALAEWMAKQESHDNNDSITVAVREADVVRPGVEKDEGNELVVSFHQFDERSSSSKGDDVVVVHHHE